MIESKTRTGIDYVTLILAIIGGVAGVGLGFYYGEAGALSALFPWCRWLFAGYLIGTTRLLNGDELKRVLVIFILFLFSILFWMTYEQAGSSLTLFADRLTRTTILGWTYPSSWFQSVPAIFVIIFAPIIGAVWQKLGKPPAFQSRQVHDRIVFCRHRFRCHRVRCNPDERWSR